MARLTNLFAALLLTAAVSALAQKGAATPQIEYPSNQGTIRLTIGLQGPDLGITYDFENPVKSYLTADEPFVSCELELDTDNDAKTGWAQIDDPRRGSDYSINIIVRPAANEVYVSRWVLDKQNGWMGSVVETKPRLSMDGTRMSLLVPASAIGIRKGQQVRFIPVAGGFDVTVEKTLAIE